MVLSHVWFSDLARGTVSLLPPQRGRVSMCSTAIIQCCLLKHKEIILLSDINTLISLDCHTSTMENLETGSAIRAQPENWVDWSLVKNGHNLNTASSTSLRRGSFSESVILFSSSLMQRTITLSSMINRIYRKGRFASINDVNSDYLSDFVHCLQSEQVEIPQQIIVKSEKLEV